VSLPPQTRAELERVGPGAGGAVPVAKHIGSIGYTSPMAEFEANLWAPWRMAYIEALGAEDPQTCFLCHHHAHAELDVSQHVLWRTAQTLTLLNKFPYSTGHMLIAPAAHVARFEDLPESTLSELTLCLRDAQRVLQAAFHPHGFNVGMNVGRCAGAGLPDHLHWHIVPRWNGDTNFMPALGGVKVMPESLDQVYARVRAAAAQLGLPPVDAQS
jgi:ATP adenylyltransferase